MGIHPHAAGLSLSGTVIFGRASLQSKQLFPMCSNKANPNGPQYNGERRDESTSGIHLPSNFLVQAWNRELRNICRNLSTPAIMRGVSRASGFAWALRAADLINEDVHKAMGEAIAAAEKAAYVRLDQGQQESK